MLKKLQHWSPALSISLVINIALLQVFIWLISVKGFGAPKQNTLTVQLRPTVSQDHKIQPKSIVPKLVEKPPAKKVIVKKDRQKKPKAVKISPPRKKAVTVVKKIQPKKRLHHQSRPSKLKLPIKITSKKRSLSNQT
jgi:hypothetical protein